jgi:hypothetical protein
MRIEIVLTSETGLYSSGTIRINDKVVEETPAKE